MSRGVSPERNPFETTVLAALCTVAAVGAASAEESDFCAERPGQTTPPCVMDPGRVMIETAGTTWTLDDHGSSRTDTVIFADSVLRVGVMQNLEAQAGWTPAGVVWSEDKSAHATTTRSSTGDVRLGLLYALAGRNGPVSVQGFVTLPTGGGAIGAGDWGAGVRLPVGLPIGHGVQFALTPEIDAEVNSGGSGRHVAYGGAVGVGLPLSSRMGFSVDLAVFRHAESVAPTTTATAGASFTWQAAKNTQFDLGSTFGLNANSPNAQVYVGIAHRF